MVEIMRVVICGAGVIGACTAYFLSRRGIDVVVLERTDVPRHPARQAGFWRSTGAPARRSMRWRGEVLNFMPPCPTKLRAIGATAAWLPIAGSSSPMVTLVVTCRRNSIGVDR